MTDGEKKVLWVGIAGHRYQSAIEVDVRQICDNVLSGYISEMTVREYNEVLDKLEAELLNAIEGKF
jgi:hypothetical protein